MYHLPPLCRVVLLEIHACISMYQVDGDIAILGDRQLIGQPGLKAQVYVVCDKTKLLAVLFEKEPNVTLLVLWAK